MKDFSERLQNVIEEIYDSIKDIDPDADDFDTIVYHIRSLFEENLPEYPLDQIVDSTIEEIHEIEQ